MKKGGSENGTWIGYKQIRGVKAGWEEVRGARANIGDQWYFVLVPFVETLSNKKPSRFVSPPTPVTRAPSGVPALPLLDLFSLCVVVAAGIVP